MAPKALTDAEMAALEAKEGGGLTDEQMAALEAKPAAVEPSRMERIANFLRTEGRGAADAFTGNAKAAADTASMGVLPRVLAVGDALGGTLNGHGGLVDNYDTALTQRQADSRQTAQDHPSASIVGGFMLPPVAKGAGVAQRLVAAGGTGTLAGYLNAPHDNPDAQRAGMLAGGIGGLAMQGASESVAPMSGALSRGLRDYSGRQAANVAGGGRGQINDRMAKLGFDPSEHADFGNQLLDEGLIPTGLHPTQPPVAGVLDRARALKASQGSAIGEELSQADVNGAFDPLEAQKQMRSGLQARVPTERENSSKANNLIRQTGDLAAAPSAMRPGNSDAYSSFADANLMKSQSWDAANFKDDVPMEAKQFRRSVAGMRDSIRDQVGQVSGSDSADRLTAANRRFGVAADAEELSKNAVSRGGQSQQFGLPAAMMMAAGAGAGSMAGGAYGAGAGTTAGLIGASLLKSRGPTIAARLGRTGSNMAGAVGNASQNPLATGAAGGAESSLLSDYLRPMDDEERQKSGADNYSRQTGGR